ncbi:diguanylate cyclase (GGDEF)-like protein [Palleronia aestuarii]|uniref:Diguanylate cyclase (GGDEF)-like protein n=1 Tax=Palleronia aestuarii TaxID=568105 RepID=A0A2W7MTV6_9RHOB|nr:bifunctional diguanylate cyclase/phosphodiesterase [Palleronia aestuarii]PZX11428.1 diguanylate cyclase (GGDEF)-like protein [Palleronia aestuarii]
MNQTSLSRQIVVIALVLIVAFIVTIWASLLSIRSAMNRQAAEASIELVRGRIAAYQEQVSLIASDYHNWTDVYQAAVDQDFDELYSNYGITAVRGDVFQYAEMFDGPFDAPASWQVGSAREPRDGILSAETLAVLEREVPELDFNERETFDFLEYRDGDLVMFSASWLLPEDIFVMPEINGGNLAIAVIGKALSRTQIENIETDLDLAELQLQATPVETGPVSLRLDEPSGSPAVYLSWLPPTPGTELFRRVRPVMAAVTITFILLAGVAARLLRGKAKELIAKEAETAARARTDPLTGLPNRLALNEYLEALRKDDPTDFAVISLDIDGFKRVNDLVGHAAGDTYLKVFSERLAALTAGGTFVARLGGDEFIVVIDDDGSDLSAKVADTCQLVERLHRDKVMVGGYAFDVYAAKGLAFSTGCQLEIEEVLRNADRAMYMAKQRRRQEVVQYDASMEASVALDNSIERALRSALLTGSEFYLEYQPIVNARFPNGIAKFEALARWDSPELGRVTPDDFIRVAEMTGLILPLGKLLLDIACKDLRAHPAPRVSINVSAVQLMSPRFAEEFVAKIISSDLDPRRIEIEITETVAISDNKSVAATLHELRSRGISIALDDFGTGFSSVGYLASMPFDTLKIDRSFVSGKVASNRTIKMVRSMITLANSLDMQVVAEGIEREGEAEMLRHFGCDMFQGFHYGRPGLLSAFFDTRQMELDLGIA